jgi:hypothetical protein
VDGQLALDSCAWLGARSVCKGDAVRDMPGVWGTGRGVCESGVSVQYSRASSVQQERPVAWGDGSAGQGWLAIQKGLPSSIMPKLVPVIRHTDIMVIGSRACTATADEKLL